MKVRELIAELLKLPQDLTVIVDDDGVLVDAWQVYVMDDGKVLIS